MKNLLIASVCFLLAGFCIGRQSAEPQQTPEPTPNGQFLEYQIEVEPHGAYIYDGARYVGFVPYDTVSEFNRLILKDNL